MDGSRFIHNYSKEPEKLAKDSREVNDELCDNYHDDEQAVQQQERQNEYEKVVQERLEEAAHHLSMREDEATSVGSKIASEEGRENKETTGGDAEKFARRQSLVMDEVLRKATGKNTADWVRTQPLLTPIPDKSKGKRCKMGTPKWKRNCRTTGSIDTWKDWRNR